MKKASQLFIIYSLALIAGLKTEPAHAQIPIVSLINSAIKKVIVALDLKVQQLQNETIWLQNAEKELENKMALGNLADVSGWLDKERNLYKGYYDELQRVKAVISGYNAVKRIIEQQARLVGEYKNAYSLFRQDKNFSPAEISYMGNVYDGILQESIRNLDEVMLAVNSFQTQMSDAQRLQLIHTAGDHLQHNLDNLRQFNAGNMQLTLQRAKERDDMDAVRQLYGLPKN